MNQTNCEKHKRLEWNTYEKLTCWRMLKSNFCTFFFILRVLCFVFLLFSLSNAPYFPCPVISSSLGAFCCSFGRRNERTKVYQSIPKFQIHPSTPISFNKQHQKYQNKTTTVLLYSSQCFGLALGSLGSLGFSSFSASGSAGLPPWCILMAWLLRWFL